MKNISIKRTTVCSRDKECTGSIDGITYMYSDGTTDKGIECNRVTYTNCEGDTCIRWLDINNNTI